MPDRSMMMYWTVGISIFLVVGVFALLYNLGLTQPSSSTNSNVPVLRQETAEITQDRPVMLTLPEGNASLYVPCCTFGVGGTISMVEAEANIFSQPPGLEQWLRPNVINVEYYDASGDLVENATTSTPVQVCYQLTDAQWESYLSSPADFQIQRYDTQLFSARWRNTEVSTNEAEKKLCASSNKLALFALAVRQTGAEIPITGADGPYQP
jgi:hypothetical protein